MTLSRNPLKFLVIDDNADTRTLLAKTLLRKFPESVVQECQHGDTAIVSVRAERMTAIIAHRTFDYDGETLIRLLRHVDREVPIIMVSGNDKREIACAAGADAFMNYDAWLTIGTVVAEAVKTRRAANTKPTPAAEREDLSEPETV